MIDRIKSFFNVESRMERYKGTIYHYYISKHCVTTSIKGNMIECFLRKPVNIIFFNTDSNLILLVKASWLIK